MTEAIAILALCVSTLLLIIQYTNQLERRHGEITQIRSDLLIRLSLIQQRVTSIRMHLETARIQLRKTLDSDDKYDAIEAMPDLIKAVKELEDNIQIRIRNIETMDTRKNNRSEALLSLQKQQHQIKIMEESTASAEKGILAMMETKHTEDDSTGKIAKET